MKQIIIIRIKNKIKFLQELKKKIETLNYKG